MIVTRQDREGDAFSEDLRDDLRETARIVYIVAVVVTEGLLIKVTEQMKRLNRNVGSADTALQETPEVLNAVCVDSALGIAHRVIDDRIGIVLRQPFIGEWFVSVERSTSFDVLSDFRWKGCL